MLARVWGLVGLAGFNTFFIVRCNPLRSSGLLVLCPCSGFCVAGSFHDVAERWSQSSHSSLVIITPPPVLVSRPSVESLLFVLQLTCSRCHQHQQSLLTRPSTHRRASAGLTSCESVSVCLRSTLIMRSAWGRGAGVVRLGMAAAVFAKPTRCLRCRCIDGGSFAMMGIGQMLKGKWERKTSELSSQRSTTCARASSGVGSLLQPHL